MAIITNLKPPISIKVKLSTPRCDKIIKGINFCTVKTSINSTRLIFIIILNIQLWKGGRPSLKMIANPENRADISITSIVNIEIRNTTDADLCETKYLTPTIIESSVAPLSKIGIIHNMLISKHTHCNSNLSTLTAPRIHKVRIDKYPAKELK